MPVSEGARAAVVRQHGRRSRQDSADSTGGAVRGCRLRLAQKLSPGSSGSIATSSAASRHRSAGLRRRPSSSKMRTSARVRPSSAKTSSRAALALAGRSITSVTPALEVTVNFMARSPNCIVWTSSAATECSKGTPAPKGVSTRGGRQSLAGRQAPGPKFELTARARSIDTKVDAANWPPSPRIPLKHHFRSIQILSPFILVDDHRQHGHPGHAIFEVA
jgi:hypothetical protein